MSSRLRAEEQLLDCLDEPVTDDVLIQLAMDKYGIVLEEKDLQADIPASYAEDNSNTICEFEEVMTRLQKEITKQHSERILAGKESLKSINETLKTEHANDEIALLDSDLNEGLDHSCYSARYLIDVPEIIRNFQLKLEKEIENTILQKKVEEKSGPVLETQNSHQGWMDDKNMEFEIVDDEGSSPGKLRKFEQSSRRTGNGMRQRQSLPTSTTKTLKLSTIPKPSQKFHQQSTAGADDSVPSLVISSVKSLAPSANLSPIKGSISSASGIFSPNKHYPSAAPKFTSGIISPEFESSRKDIVEKTRIVVAGRDKHGQPIYQVQKLPRDEAQTGFSPLTSETGVRRISRINPEVIQVQSREADRRNFILSKDDRRQSPFKVPNAPRQATSATAKPTIELEKPVVDEKKQSRMREEAKLRHMQLAQAEKARTTSKNSESEYFTCRACHKIYPKDCDIMFKNHMLIKHSVELDEATIQSHTSTNSPDFNVWYKCLSCKQMMQPRFLKGHKTKCQPHIKAEDSFIKIRKTLPVANPVRCGICYKQCESRVSLRQHLIEEHDPVKKILIDPALRCGQCLRKFESPIPLTLHAITCNEAKPHLRTVLEIAQSLLYCEICSKHHTTHEECFECYSKKGFVRCMLCLYTVMNRNHFFNHLKTHHRRTSGGLPCPFCDEFSVSKVQETFEHVLAKHYKPILVQAAQGSIIPDFPTPVPNQFTLDNYARQRQSKEKMMAQQAARSKSNGQSMIPPGIVINTSRVSTAANQTAASSVSPVIQILSSAQLVRFPTQQGQQLNIPGSSAPTGTGVLQSNFPQIQLLASPTQGGQRFQYLSSPGVLPPGFQFVTPQVRFLKGGANTPSNAVRTALKQGPVPPGSRIIPIPNVIPIPVDQVGSLPVTNGTNSAVVASVTKPIVITRVSGSGGGIPITIVKPIVTTGGAVNSHAQPGSPVFNRTVLPARNTYPKAIGNRTTPVLIAPKPPAPVEAPRLTATPAGTSTTQSFSDSVVSPRIVPGQKTPTTSNSQTVCRTEDTDALNSQKNSEKDGNGRKYYNRRLNELKENVDK